MPTWTHPGAFLLPSPGLCTSACLGCSSLMVTFRSHPFFPPLQMITYHPFEITSSFVFYLSCWPYVDPHLPCFALDHYSHGAFAFLRGPQLFLCTSALMVLEARDFNFRVPFIVGLSVGNPTSLCWFFATINMVNLALTFCAKWSCSTQICPTTQNSTHGLKHKHEPYRNHRDCL
jgi:hypothetical protein